jgi:hypothetical protein
MSNPLGQQDLVGNRLTMSDLLNSATKSGPAAVGSGLPSTYVAGAVTLSANASSNAYQIPYAEGLVLLVSLASGSASAVLNTGATVAALQQVSITAVNVNNSTSGSMSALFLPMPSASLGTSTPGAPTAPFVSVTILTSGCQVKNLAILPLGYLVPNAADWFSVRSGINAVASGVVNSNDTIQPPTNLIGSGSFLVDDQQ